jgi:hypothetical protein
MVQLQRFELEGADTKPVTFALFPFDKVVGVNGAEVEDGAIRPMLLVEVETSLPREVQPAGRSYRIVPMDMQPENGWKYVDSFRNTAKNMMSVYEVTEA